MPVFINERKGFILRACRRSKSAMGSVQGVSWLSRKRSCVFKTAWLRLTNMLFYVLLLLAVTSLRSVGIFKLILCWEKVTINSVHKQAFLDPNILACTMSTQWLVSKQVMKMETDVLLVSSLQYN